MSKIGILVDDLYSVGGEESYALSLKKILEDSHEVYFFTGFPRKENHVNPFRQVEKNVLRFYKVISLGSHRIPVKFMDTRELGTFDAIYCTSQILLAVNFAVLCRTYSNSTFKNFCEITRV